MRNSVRLRAAADMNSILLVRLIAVEQSFGEWPVAPGEPQ
jgi:hypothetical protein